LRLEGGSVRGLKLAVALVTTILIFTAPVMAQSPGAADTPAAQQYRSCTGVCVQDLRDGARAVADEATRSSGAVNDALTGAKSTANDNDEAAPSDGAAPTGTVAGLTELPETGGAKVVGLGVGILLMYVGLLARRAIR
jgi:hypothetical protein